MAKEYTRNRVEESQLGSALHTLAAWAGAGIAVAVAGPAAVKGAGHLFSGLSKKAAQIGKIAGGNERLSQALLSDSFNSVVQGASDVGERITTAKRQHQGVTGFFDRLMDRANSLPTQEKVEATTKQLEAVRERIEARVAPVVLQGSRKAVKTAASDPEFIDDMLEITKGIDLGFDSRDSVTDWVTRNVPYVRPSKNSTEGVERSGYTKIKEALLGKHKEQAKKEALVSEAVKMPIKSSQLTMKDMVANYDELAKLNDNQIDDVLADPTKGIKLTEAGEAVQKKLQEAGGDAFVTNKMAELMKSTRTNFGKNNYSDWMTQVGNIQTGLIYQPGGQVLSAAKAQKTFLRNASKVLDEATLPLFPGMFHVNLNKMFGFLKSDNISIKQLGKIKHLGEVTRRNKEKLASETVGFGVGSKILTFNPITNDVDLLDGSYSFYSGRISKTTKDTARRRAGIGLTSDEKKSDNLLKQVWQYIKSDNKELDILDESIYANQSKLFNTVVGADGVALIPRGDLTNMGFDSIALRKITPGGAVPLDHLHPDLLKQVLDNDDASIIMKQQAAELLTKHAARSHGSTAATIKSQINQISEEDSAFVQQFFEEESTNAGWLTKLLANSGEDSNKLLGVISEFFKDPKKRANLQKVPKMNKVFANLLEDPEALDEVVAGDQGFLNVLQSSLKGHKEVSKLRTDLEGAMIEDVLAAQGLLKLKKKGFFDGNWQEKLKTIAEETPDPNDQLVQLLAETVGLDISKASQDQTIKMARETAASLLSSVEGKMIDNSSLRSLARVAADLPNTKDDIYNARAALSKIESIRTQSLEVGLETTGYLTELAAAAANSKSIGKINKERFAFGRANFRPATPQLDEVYGQQYHVTEKLLTDNANLNDVTRQTLISLVDSDKAMNSLGYALTTLGQIPDDIGAAVGLGLKSADKLTLSHAMLGFGLKRVLPLVVGVELYKNINADADNMDLPGIDDFAANLYANTGVGLTTVFDTLGMTQSLKQVRDSVIGLDQYIEPRSKEEFDDWLQFGDEEVRSGRFWVIGSKNNFTGGGVEGFRPNFYRRMKSNWMAAENVEIADPMHSFLPTLSNPLAPIWGLFRPWEVRHRFDRPYLNNNLKETLGAPLFAEPGEITIDRSGPYTLMTGGGLPAAVWGEGQGEVGETLGEEAAGGGGGFTGQGISPVNYITTRKPVHSRENDFILDAILNKTSDVLDQFRSQTGLYGAFMNLLIPSDKGMRIQTQQVGDAIGINRFLNDARLGELSGPFGEYFRRFLGMQEKNYTAYSPYLNNMPSWVPAHLRCITQDTLVEVDGTNFIPAKELTAANKVRNRSGQLDTIKNLVWRDMDPDEKLYEITPASTNLSFKVTEEHPIWTPTGWREIQHIEEGDWVGYPIPELSSLVTKNTKINLLDYTSNDYTCTKDWLYPSKKISLSYATLLEYVEKYELIEWEQGECKAVCEKLGIPWYRSLSASVRRAKNIDRMPLTIDIESYSWAIFLGYYLSVGYIINDRIFFKFKNPDKHTLNTLREALEELFNLELKIDIRKKSYQLVHVSCKPLVEFVRNFIGIGEERKVILGYENKRRFLKAFIKGYGFVRNQKPVNKLSFKTLYHIWQLLLTQRIGCTIENGYLKCQYVQREEARRLINMGYEIKARKSIKVLFAGRFVYFRLLKKKEVPQERVLGITVAGRFSFCLPGLLTHNTGDPYTRVPFGELVLPGDALERAAPWVTRTKVRGSMIGLSEEEMLEKLLDPIKTTEAEAVEYGSYAHKQGQKQLHDAGILIAAEIPIYDAENNISGTIDAIVRDPDGPLVVEIKSQQNSTFSQGIIPEKYLDQLNFYLATTGQQRGLLAFVNSERPEQTRMHMHYFDPERHERVLQRIQNVREKINDMIEDRVISPFESYDLISRMTVLSKAAPNSREFYELAEVAAKNSGMSGYEQGIYENLVKQANTLKRQHRLYGHRAFSNNTTSVQAKIVAVNDDGTVTTNKGTFKLAGVEFDRQASAFKSKEEILAEVGLRVGDSERFIINEGGKIEDLRNETTLSAIAVAAPGLPSMNEQLVQKGYANVSVERNNPLDYYAIYGNPDITETLWGAFAHNQNVITDKFIRVRSPLEQLKRGEVYGSDYLNWGDPIGTLLLPTIQSLASQNFVESSMKGSILLSLLGRTAEAKGKLALAGASIGLLSLAREGYEAFYQTTWTPGGYEKRQKIDEYFDKLEYIKQSAIAEHSKLKAYILEGVNIDALSQEEERVEYRGVGKWTVIALQADKKARNTMYGYNTAKGTLQQAIMTLPERHRQIVEEAILYGSRKEKDEVYSYLSDSEKRVVAKYLGKEEMEREKLSDFFKETFLPDASWRGWRQQFDLEDIKLQSLEESGTSIAPGSSSQLAQARERTRGVLVPVMDANTIGSIEGRIQRILYAGGSAGSTVKVSARPSSTRQTRANFNISIDQSKALEEQLLNNLHREQ